MSKKKFKDDIDFEGMSYEEFLEARKTYLAKMYHKLAEESYKEKCKDSNISVEPLTRGITYATTSDYSHS